MKDAFALYDHILFYLETFNFCLKVYRYIDIFCLFIPVSFTTLYLLLFLMDISNTLVDV